MLNEILEYKNYTADREAFTAEENGLKYGPLISRHLSGLQRALTVIARAFLYPELPPLSCPMEGTVLTRRQRTGLSLLSLSAWCGMEGTASPDITFADIPEELRAEIERISGWLPEYLRYHLYLNIGAAAEKKGAAEEIEKLPPELKSLFSDPEDSWPYERIETRRLALMKELKSLPAKCGLKSDMTKLKNCLETIEKLYGKKTIKGNTFLEPLFPEPKGFKNDTGNTLKMITFEKIIADAMEAGPLQEYVLLCTGMLPSLYSSDKPKKNRDSGEVIIPDSLLKATALFLMSPRSSGQEYVLFNESEAANWASGKGSSRGDKFMAAIKDYRLPIRDDYGKKLAEEPFFTHASVSGNMTKICISPKWASHFKAVTRARYEAMTEYDKPFRVFEDRGAGKPLEKTVELFR